MSGYRPPIVAGVSGGVGTTILALALHGRDAGTDTAQADLLVCRSSVESLDRAARIADLAWPGRYPVLLVTLDGTERRPPARLARLHDRWTAVVPVPHVALWRELADPYREAAGLLGSPRAGLPRPVRALADAIRRAARVVAESGRLSGPPPASATDRPAAQPVPASTGFGTVLPHAGPFPGTLTGPPPATGHFSAAGSFPAAVPLPGAAPLPGAGPLPDFGPAPGPEPLPGDGQYPATGRFPAAGPVSATGPFPAAGPVSAAGSFPSPMPPGPPPRWAQDVPHEIGTAAGSAPLGGADDRHGLAEAPHHPLPPQVPTQPDEPGPLRLVHNPVESTVDSTGCGEPEHRLPELHPVRGIRVLDAGGVAG